ncbi:MAG: hypothetical protein H0X37_16400 [Herpetosiphonaceae bacterium]|nr:hypothetical protein [Herpetosiphonaceae bacterium]
MTMLPNTFKNQIEHHLKVLIGLPLWNAGRAATIEWFQFGNPRTVPATKGNTKEVGDYALHIQCAWRLVNNEGVIAGSSDRYFPSGDDPYDDKPDFDWDEQGANRCDERVRAFFDSRTLKPLIVESIQVGLAGAFQLSLGDQVALEVFPDHSLRYEYWRLLRPATEEEHFVVTGLGIES